MYGLIYVGVIELFNKFGATGDSKDGRNWIFEG
jgi:hypothetical protein